jgi:hypothetical protein
LSSAALRRRLSIEFQPGEPAMTAKLPVLLVLTLLAEPQPRPYADFREYEMPRDAEVALTRSAALDVETT